MLRKDNMKVDFFWCSVDSANNTALVAQKRCVAALPPRPLDPSTPLAFVPTVLKLLFAAADGPRYSTRDEG